MEEYIASDAMDLMRELVAQQQIDANVEKYAPTDNYEGAYTVLLNDGQTIKVAPSAIEGNEDSQQECYIMSIANQHTTISLTSAEIILRAFATIITFKVLPTDPDFEKERQRAQATWSERIWSIFRNVFIGYWEVCSKGNGLVTEVTLDKDTKQPIASCLKGKVYGITKSKICQNDIWATIDGLFVGVGKPPEDISENTLVLVLPEYSSKGLLKKEEEISINNNRIYVLKEMYNLQQTQTGGYYTKSSTYALKVGVSSPNKISFNPLDYLIAPAVYSATQQDYAYALIVENVYKQYENSQKYNIICSEVNEEDYIIAEYAHYSTSLNDVIHFFIVCKMINLPYICRECNIMHEEMHIALLSKTIIERLWGPPFYLLKPMSMNMVHLWSNCLNCPIEPKYLTGIQIARPQDCGNYILPPFSGYLGANGSIPKDNLTTIIQLENNKLKNEKRAVSSNHRIYNKNKRY